MPCFDSARREAFPCRAKASRQGRLAHVDQMRIDVTILLDCLDEALAAVSAHREGHGDYKRASQQLAKVSLLARRCQESQERVTGWLTSDVVYQDAIVTSLLDINELLVLALEKYAPLHSTNLDSAAAAGQPQPQPQPQPPGPQHPHPPSPASAPSPNTDLLNLLNLLSPRTTFTAGAASQRGAAPSPAPGQGAAASSDLTQRAAAPSQRATASPTGGAPAPPRSGGPGTAHATSQQGGAPPPGVSPVGGGNGGPYVGSSHTGAPPGSSAQRASSPAGSGTGGAVGGGGGNTGAQQGGSTGAAAVGLLEGQVASLREQLSSVATSAGIASLAHAADLASASSAHAAQVAELKRQAVTRVEELLRANASAQGELRGLHGKLEEQAQQLALRAVVSQPAGSGAQGASVSAADSASAVAAAAAAAAAAAEARAAQHWAAEVGGARGRAAELEAALSGKEGEMAALRAATMALAASTARQVASLSAQLQAAQMQLRKAGNKPQAAAPLDSGPRAAAAAVTTAASAQQPLVSWEQRQLTREREGSEESKLLDAGEGSSSQGHLAVPLHRSIIQQQQQQQQGQHPHWLGAKPSDTVHASGSSVDDHQTAGGSSSLSVADRRSSGGSSGQVAYDWSTLTAGLLEQALDLVNGFQIQQVRLVCRHWRAVSDGYTLSLSPVEMRSAALVARFPALRSLELLRCANVRNRDLQTIVRAGPPLHTLLLGDNTTKPWVTNAGVEVVARLASLTCLGLQDCNSITNQGLRPLSRLTALKSLSLKGCRKLTNGGMEVIAGLTSLTSLNLHGVKRLHAAGLQPLRGLLLLELALGSSCVKDEGLAHVAALTSLRRLMLTQEDVSDAGLLQLSSLQSLTSFGLRECSSRVAGSCLPVLARHWPMLTELDLRKASTKVTPEGVRRLQGIPSLTNLRLEALLFQLPEPFFAACGALPQLRSLTLEGHGCLTPRMVEHIRHLPKLRELDLSRTGPVPTPVIGEFGFGSGTEERLDPVSPVAMRKLHTLTLVGCNMPDDTHRLLGTAFPNLTISRNHRQDPTPQQQHLHNAPPQEEH
ncbi:MAG: hypothetical protein WDW38_005181 [Sanguina aurantia]